ncbi:right-handed parallel beta-helix repeat-containing protein [Telmatobacter sp. DSM 110680]|uniref:Right-handed parallel beta-helix repeat-containing protein n=1 Tax=Telmatobacter sp. DSM 110680 TaxID=3036704 RepID=A0AAU7DL59_9BACT
MQSTKFITAMFLATLAFAGARARCQANITESQNPAIYVDSEKGSDAALNAMTTMSANAALAKINSVGTSVAPLQTIQSAINLATLKNQLNVGAKIIVNPGVYRESLNIGASQTAAPLTIEAATTGTTYISGSDAISGGWSAQSGGVYSHAWTYNFGTCPTPSGWPSMSTLARRTEMVFVNGNSLTQVLSSSSLSPGKFYVNESSNQLLIKPPVNTNMSTASVEVATRSQILSISGRSNVVVRGMVIEHARSCVNQNAAVISNSSGVLVDNVQAVWNNWGGLEISNSNNITVQNSVGSHNGGVGFHGYQDTNSLWENNKTDYNNWRGAEGGLLDWGMGGFKSMLMHTATVLNHHSYGNQAQGLWFDTDNKNITINGVYLSNNELADLQLEASEGPITVENSHLCNSRAGVELLNAAKVTFKSNTFYNNGTSGQQYDAQIFLGGRSGGHVIRDWQSGAYYNIYTNDTVMTGNVVVDSNSGQHVFGTYLSSGAFYDFKSTLNAGSNRWYDPHTTSAFELVNGSKVSFSGWKSAMGTDYSSSWGAPSSSPAGACAIAAQ